MRRARFTFALVATLLAIVVQWCVPLAHALHASAEAAVAARCAAHDGGGGDGDAHHAHRHTSHDQEPDPNAPAHDDSTCHTCQQFIAARAMALPSMSVALVSLRATDAGAATLYPAPYVPRIAPSLAVPRGPPASR